MVATSNHLLHIHAQEGVCPGQDVAGSDLVQVITTAVNLSAPPHYAQNSASIPSCLWLLHSFFLSAIMFPEPRSR